MTITMQGNWTVRVKSKTAAFQQRFQIIGSDFSDGTYIGDVSTAPVFVTGSQWSLNIQNQPTSQPWRDSEQRITFPTTSGGLVRFDIRSNDSSADQDFDDLILTCSMPVSSGEFILYGNVQTYAGPCLFNPCYPWYYVIDTPAALDKALAIPDLRRILEKLYPERVPVRIPPIPMPDPPPDFKPILLSSGLASQAGGLEFRSRAGSDAVGAGLTGPGSLPLAGRTKKTKPATPDANALEEATLKQLSATIHNAVVNPAPLRLGADALTRSDLFKVASIADKYKIAFLCDNDPAPGLLLNFQEYDRTDSEKLGSPYTGTGVRENLGLAVTDSQGNYIFHFSRSLGDFATEASDVATGETFSVQIRPDVIVQVLGTGLAVNYETAPYFNIPNLRRIDLCVPRDRVHPSGGCAGDRVIQRIGDVTVLHSALSGHPNTLDADGRITCRNVNAPAVDCAGWRGDLRMYACFGKPAVSSYTLRYFRQGIDSDWQFVDENFKLNHIPDFAVGYTGTPVGSTLRPVRVDGGALVTRPTYDNHEGDSNWIENDLKLILNSFLYRPGEQPGPVDFKIEGYDSAGNRIVGTDDIIRLYIHNQSYILGRPGNSKGDIASITMGVTTLGDCALFELSSPNAPLTVRYRAVDPTGFLHSWALGVTRGNNVPVATGVASGVTPKSFATAAAPCNFKGTRDEVSADPDDYILTALQPASGNWLPDGYNFCAFAFTLTAADRVTDGRTAYPQVVFWQDLIGLSSG